MIADRCSCAPGVVAVRATSRVRARLAWLGLLPALAYALAPKCPLCLVAYLSAFGVTVGVASAALSILEPLTVAGLTLTVGFAIRRTVKGLR